MRQSEIYEKSVVGSPTLAIVLEDNIWEYGKEKKKAKINIPSLMPLQQTVDSAVTTSVTVSDNIQQSRIERTQNFIEIFLPDNLYTYPSENLSTNPSQSLYGARKSNPLNNGKNGKYTNTLIRRVDKDTKIVVIVIDGYIVEENIKVLFKYDDYDERRIKHHGITANTIKAALR